MTFLRLRKRSKNERKFLVPLRLLSRIVGIYIQVISAVDFDIFNLSAVDFDATSENKEEGGCS